MALLPSHLKGAPASPPLLAKTTAGKMYVNVHFFWYCFFYFIYFCSFTAGRGWCCCHHPRKACLSLTVRHCRQRQRRGKCMYFLTNFSVFVCYFSLQEGGGGDNVSLPSSQDSHFRNYPHPNKYLPMIE